MKIIWIDRIGGASCTCLLLECLYLSKLVLFWCRSRCQQLCICEWKGTASGREIHAPDLFFHRLFFWRDRRIFAIWVHISCYSIIGQTWSGWCLWLGRWWDCCFWAAWNWRLQLCWSDLGGRPSGRGARPWWAETWSWSTLLLTCSSCIEISFLFSIFQPNCSNPYSMARLWVVWSPALFFWWHCPASQRWTQRPSIYYSWPRPQAAG